MCELLKGTGVAGCPEEFFEAVRSTGLPPHPGDYLVGLPRTGAGIRDDPSAPEAPKYSSLVGLTNYREHLERSFAWGTPENGVFGAKLMWNQLVELQALAGELPEYAGLEIPELLTRMFRDPLFVWVTRADKVRQAVSLWKALQTRSWRHGGHGKRPVELHYRFEGIDHLVAMFKSDDRSWGAFFAEQEITPVAITYEVDMEHDPDGAVRAVLAQIGVQAPGGWSADPPMQRQADALSEEWVASYIRDRAQRDAQVDAAVAAR